MKTAGVIAEYNPFHLGHEYLLRKIREDSGADFIVVVMSGDFVQRGAPALLDKYRRTEMALRGGADLVLELPCAAAIGSAGDFASGAVTLMDRLGVVDELWFGSECGRIRPLSDAAGVLAEEPPVYREVLRSALARGSTYPEAQEAGLRAAVPGRGGTLAEILKKPNNLLAVAYLTAMARRNSRMIPRTVRRSGGDHHSESRKAYSSENIRENIGRGYFSSAARTLPPYSAKILLEAADRNELIYPDDFSDMILCQLQKETAKSLRKYPGIGEDLANRIIRMRGSFRSVLSFSELLKTRNYTMTRISRALFSVLLGVEKRDAAREKESVRVLGLKKRAEALLGEISRSGTVRPCGSAASLPADSFRTDVSAANLYEAVRAKKSGTAFHHEFAQKVIKLL